MRKVAKLVTGAALIGMAASGCTSSYEDVRGGGNSPFLGASESYANPENFLVTTMHTDDKGVSMLALKGCVEVEPDGYEGVETLGNGYQVDAEGQSWLTGRNTALETDRFRDAEPIRAETPAKEALYPALAEAPMSFIAGEHSVECGYWVRVPETVEDQQSGQELTVTAGNALLGSVVNVHIDDKGQLDPATFTVLAGGSAYSVLK